MTDKNVPVDLPVEEISLDELDELMEAQLCSNCGAELTVGESDDWGLCPECHTELNAHDEDEYKPLNFHVED